jgi:hypothetical protein
MKKFQYIFIFFHLDSFALVNLLFAQPGSHPKIPS